MKRGWENPLYCMCIQPSGVVLRGGIMKKKISETNKMEEKISNIMPYIIFIITGLIIGISTGELFSKSIDNKGFVGALITIVILFIEVIVTIFAHVIIHEAGHLIFGLLSGYQFVSFRIGSLMFIKENGKIKPKRFNVVGTGGQCLMMPPGNVNTYNYSYKLYGLGGIIANIISALISLILFFMLPKTDYLSEFMIIFFALGMALALINGIPLKISGFANDGYNIISLNKDKEARRSHYLQLYINGLQTKGTRLKDMPEEYFELPDSGDLTNPLIVTIGVFKSNYLHDKQDFNKAKETSIYLIENAPGLLGVHKSELQCELLFYEVIGLCRQDEIEKLYTKELQQYIENTSFYVSRRRLMYGYEIFVNHDRSSAKAELERFEQVAEDYPFKSEVEAEREMIKFIDNLAVIKNVNLE